MVECAKCERVWPEDRFNLNGLTPSWCFACRSKSVRVGFQGGKEYFHSDTEANRSRLAINEATAAGFEPVPAETGKSWNAASPKSVASAGQVSKQAGAFGGKPAVTETVKVGS